LVGSSEEKMATKRFTDGFGICPSKGGMAFLTVLQLVFSSRLALGNTKHVTYYKDGCPAVMSSVEENDTARVLEGLISVA